MIVVSDAIVAAAPVILGVTAVLATAPLLTADSTYVPQTTESNNAAVSLSLGILTLGTGAVADATAISAKASPAALAATEAKAAQTVDSADDLAQGLEIAKINSPSPNSSVNYNPEVRSPNPVRPAAVTDQWDNFLGEDTTAVGPNGVTYPNRIFSADGTRSIRYGNNEMANNHYHEETWTYDPITDTFDVTNLWRFIQNK